MIKKPKSITKVDVGNGWTRVVSVYPDGAVGSIYTKKTETGRLEWGRSLVPPR